MRSRRGQQVAGSDEPRAAPATRRPARHGAPYAHLSVRGSGDERRAREREPDSESIEVALLCESARPGPRPWPGHLGRSRRTERRRLERQALARFTVRRSQTRPSACLSSVSLSLASTLPSARAPRELAPGLPWKVSPRRSLKPFVARHLERRAGRAVLVSLVSRPPAEHAPRERRAPPRERRSGSTICTSRRWQRAAYSRPLRSSRSASESRPPSA